MRKQSLKRDSHRMMKIMWEDSKKGRKKSYIWLKDNFGEDVHFSEIEDEEKLNEIHTLLFMKKREAKWQIIFNKYLRESNFYGFFELKQTNSYDYFPYKLFEPHQLDSLLALKNNGLVWKLSDSDQRLKPCDCISIPNMDSFLVIKYPLAFVIIGIEEFLYEKSLGMKSLYYEQAKEIATKIIYL